MAAPSFLRLGPKLFKSCWTLLSLEPTFSQLPNTASSVLRIYPGSNYFSPSQPVPLPKSLCLTWITALTGFPVPVLALQSVFHTAARVSLWKSSQFMTPAANSAVASHFIQGQPKSFEWPTSPCVIQDHPLPLWPRIPSLPSCSRYFTTLASSLLFITAATFGSFALALLFAWNILFPGYPHAFSFTFFVSQLTRSSLAALCEEEHQLHHCTIAPPVFFVTVPDTYLLVFHILLEYKFHENRNFCLLLTANPQCLPHTMLSMKLAFMPSC